MQRYTNVAQDALGNIIQGMSVSVFLKGTQTPAALFSDNGVTSIPNPTTTDALGTFFFYAADGRYDLQFAKLGLPTTQLLDVILQDPATIAASTLLFTPAGAGAGPRSVQSKGRDVVSVLDFFANGVSGALVDPTGVLDSTGGLNAAFAMTGRFVLLPKGTYSVTANLAKPVCSGIIGEGEYVSIIQAATGVTKVLSLAGECSLLRDFQILGNATTNAIGILFGDTGSGAYGVYNVRVKGFTGTGAVGAKVFQALKSVFVKLTCEGSRINLLIDGTGTSFPTTCTFIDFVGTGATDINMKAVSGNGIWFYGSDFESATNEGVKLIPGGQTLVEIGFYNCWFEDNRHLDTANYQFVADNAGGGTCRIVLENPFFVSSGVTAKSMKVTGAGLTWHIHNPQIFNGAGQILIDPTATGGGYMLLGANIAASANTIITDTGKNNSLINTLNGTWTPTMTPGTSGTITLTAPANSMFYERREAGLGRTLLHIWGTIIVQSVAAPVGALNLGGLPVAAAANAAMAVFSYNYSGSGPGPVQGRVNTGGTTGEIDTLTAGSLGNLAASVIAGTTFHIDATYLI